MLFFFSYCIYRVEKNGTEKEKLANRNALALTAKAVILLATFELFLQLVSYLGHLVGLISSIRNADGTLAIDLALLVLVYLTSFNYYKKSEAEQAKFKTALFGQMFTKRN